MTRLFWDRRFRLRRDSRLCPRCALAVMETVSSVLRGRAPVRGLPSLPCGGHRD